jgi:hypothetical protein
VPSVVRHEIVESEAVVPGYKIDALLGLPFLVSIDVGAAQQAARQVRNSAAVALEESASVVAKAAIPFMPVVANEAADLVEARRIPSFRDHLIDSCII